VKGGGKNLFSKANRMYMYISACRAKGKEKTPVSGKGAVLAEKKPHNKRDSRESIPGREENKYRGGIGKGWNEVGESFLV